MSYRSLPLIASLVIGVLVVLASVAGLRAALSATDTSDFGVTTSTGGVVVPGFAAHDAFNLLIVVPGLIAAAVFSRRGSLLALLLLPGVLFYLVYTYAIYLVGAPFGPTLLVYAALVALSGLAIVFAVSRMDWQRPADVLAPLLPARLIGGLLVALALLTVAQDATGVILAGAGAEPLARRVWTVDLAVEAPMVLAGGVLLWQRHPLGYVAALGLLLQYGMTPLALATMLAAQPLLTGGPADVGTILGVLAFGIVCFAPVVRVALLTAQASPQSHNVLPVHSERHAV